MQVTLQDRERLNQAGKGLEDIFDTLVASIQGGWDIEHLHTGRHGHITALSMFSAGGFHERDYPTQAGVPVPFTTTLGLDWANDGVQICGWFPLGSSLFLTYNIQNFSATGGSPFGSVTLPPGFGGSVFGSTGGCWVNNNGVLVPAFFFNSPNQVIINVTLDAVTNWTASVNNTDLFLTLWVPVTPLNI